MADMTDESANLADLRLRASELVTSAQSLETLFEERVGLLRRKDQVAHLTALRSTILLEVERVRRSEKSASYAYSQVGVASALVRLCAGLIAAKSQDQTVRRISHAVYTGLRDRKPTFGTVVVGIGPRGLPEDVAVVSMSLLAREAGRNETEVIDRTRQREYALLSGNAFSTLIDSVIEKVQKGELELPVPAHELPICYSSQ